MNACVARVAPKPRATAGVLASSTSPSAPVIAPRRVVIIFVILPLRSRALKPAAGEARALQSGDDRRVASHIFRSEEHTSELQSLMRISYAVFCLKKKIKQSVILSIDTRIIETSAR